MVAERQTVFAVRLKTQLAEDMIYRGEVVS